MSYVVKNTKEGNVNVKDNGREGRRGFCISLRIYGIIPQVKIQEMTTCFGLRPTFRRRNLQADLADRASSSTPDAAAAVRNLLDSLRGHEGLSGGQERRQQQADMPYPYLNHLLPTSITVPLIDEASPEYIDSLLGFLPPGVIVLATTSTAADESQKEPSAAVLDAAKASLSADAKRSLLKKVLRSPQFHQALGTLTMALRDGGLPGVADALGVRVENGGYMVGSQMPLGGGQAVKAFIDGVKQTAKESNK